MKITDEMLAKALEELGVAEQESYEEIEAVESPPSPAMDALVAYLVVKLPGEEFVRILRENGKNHWLIKPSFLGKECYCNGRHPGIARECNGCEYLSRCHPIRYLFRQKPN